MTVSKIYLPTLVETKISFCIFTLRLSFYATQNISFIILLRCYVFPSQKDVPYKYKGVCCSK